MHACVKMILRLQGGVVLFLSCMALSTENLLFACSNLVVKVQEHLAHAGFSQHPCLGCSKQNAKLAFAV